MAILGFGERSHGLSFGTVKVVDYLSRSVALLYGVFSQLKLGTSRQDSVPCRKARIVLEGFEEHKDKFQLIFWPPNSVNLNLMGHIWVVIERQLRYQVY
ncbi:hypothetical protein TNCV_4448141 [Trichonephila clavipes]|nr:hypothetical protein TNCV_4448141 [Trichonephila clavipes]